MANKNNESTMKWKVDISQLKAAMQDAKRAISLTNAEFKTAVAGMDEWSKSTDGLEAKIKQLNQNLPKQQAILEGLQKQYKLTADSMGENSAEAQRLKIAIENQKATIIKTETNIKKYNNQLEELKREQAELNTATGKLNIEIQEQTAELEELKRVYRNVVLEQGKNSKEAKELANQIYGLSTKLAENKKEMVEAAKSAEELDKSLDDTAIGVEEATNVFTVFNGVMTITIVSAIKAVVTGLKDIAREAFNAGSNFESAMSKVQAISGASTEELNQLTEKAKEMGEKTIFSATQSAEAFNYMAMAGWKTEDMLNGIEGIMNLAAASGADLATTSDIVTDALTAMGYSAEDAGRLADVMAAASSNANTNVEMMGQTFQYAAPIIGALGYSMEDTAVAIGLMANAGIKGEKAGTALRSTLTRLSAPPKEAADAMDALGISLTDNQGNMKEMNEVIDDLRKAFANLSETEQTQYAKQLAGQEAMSGLLAIVKTAPEDYEKLTKAVEGSTGAAQEMANVMQDNVGGQITLLKSKLEGVFIKVFEKASGSIKKAIDTISKSLDKIDWDKFAKNAGKAAEAVANLFGYIVKNADYILAVLKAIATAFVTYKAVAAITAVITAFKKFMVALKATDSIMKALNLTISANPIGLLVAAVSALTVGMISWYKATENAIKAEYGLNAEQKKNLDTVAEMTEKYNELNAARNEQVESVNAEYGYIKELKDEYNGLIDSNGKVKKGYEDRANFIIDQLAKALGLERDEIQKLIEKNGELGESIDNVIIKKQAEATLLANEEMYNEAIRNRTTSLNDLMEAQQTLNDIQAEYDDHMRNNSNIIDTYNELVASGAENAWAFYIVYRDVIEGQQVLAEKLEEAKQTVVDAEGAWVGYNSTIQNYEGLSAAIISGDVDKINTALTNMQNNFILAKDGTKETLEEQVKNYETNLANLEKAIQNGTPGVTEEMRLQAQSMVTAAQEELDKFEMAASESGTKAGGGFAQYLASTKGAALRSGVLIADSAETGAETSEGLLSSVGLLAGGKFSAGVGSNKNLDDAKAQGTALAKQATVGADSENGEKGGAVTSGSRFGEGFFNGIGSWLNSVWERGKELAKKALAGLKQGQQEGSPSKLTFKSGEFFGEGYLLGIESMMNPVKEAASSIAKEAVDALGINLNDQMKEIGVDSAKSLIDGLNSAMPNVSSSVDTLKKNVSSANIALSNSQAIPAGTFAQTGNSSQTVVFNQTINSPKAVDRLSLYRDTNNLLFSAKVRLNNV